MDGFLSSQEAIDLMKHRWFETLSPTILVTGIDSFESALNSKNESAGALTALDHSSTLLSLLHLAQWNHDNDWETPTIQAEFRAEMDPENLIGIIDQNGDVSLPSIWIHLGHGAYEEYDIGDSETGTAQISLANDGDEAKSWIDTEKVRSFIDGCKLGHLLLIVLPICKSKYSKDVLSGSDKITMIIGDNEEDIGQLQVENYSNELQILSQAGYDILHDSQIHLLRSQSNDIEE